MRTAEYKIFSLTYFVSTGDKFDAVVGRGEINCPTCRQTTSI
jgi:hypothetical protein